MAIQVQGNGGVVAEVDGTGFRALRVTMRPTEYGSLGAYSNSHLSGTMAAGLAADAEIFQARWTDATRFEVLRYLTLDGLAGSATAFAAGFAKIAAFIARAWSADGSGGTAATLSGNNQKLRTSMGTTLMAAIRGSSTAALTAGTKTLDAQAFAQFVFTIGTVANVIYVPTPIPLFNDDSGIDHPPILAGTGGGEGIVVRATVPGTGTWQFGVTSRWVDVAAF